ncbi:hypothetical protein [Krasilnikovia sp. MM14-A1259]|uniref:hypothetical protein n=1 Tax=Krasilnikovia sp. MM14-A1259 TaxID=3373539 RepID=UPI00381488B5
MREREMHCVTCRRAMLFEMAAGEDADDCPELICTGCGTAEVLVPATLRVWMPTSDTRSHRVAPQQRRAA